MHEIAVSALSRCPLGRADRVSIPISSLNPGGGGDTEMGEDQKPCLRMCASPSALVSLLVSRIVSPVANAGPVDEFKAFNKGTE